MVALPAPTPVTLPVEEPIAAIVLLLVLQFPVPVSLRDTNDEPMQVTALPLIGPGNGVTNKFAVVEQPEFAV